jgi:hypothetical protein
MLLKERLMKTQITMAAVLVSMTLMLAVVVAIPAMNSVVFAGGHGDDDDCEAGNSGNDWPGNGPHKCPSGLDKKNDDYYNMLRCFATCYHLGNIYTTSLNGTQLHAP